MLKKILSYYLSHRSLFIFFVFFTGLYIYSNFYFNDFKINTELSINLLYVLLIIIIVDGLKIIIETIYAKDIKALPSSTYQVTVIIPCHNGEDTIGPVLESLLKRFKKEFIIVSLNNSTDNSFNIASKYGVYVLDNPLPLGKEGATQAALKHVTTKYVITLDDDTIIGNGKIPIELLEMGYNAIGYRVIPNKVNWLTTLQSHEYKKSMDIGRGFLNNTASVNCISGAIGLYRTKEVISQENTHTREFSGEDYQRTLLFHLDNKHLGTIITNEVIYTDAPRTIAQLFAQRAYGWNTALYGQVRLCFKVLINTNKIPLKIDILYNLIFVMGFDFLRLFWLPIIFINPYYLIVMYLTYILLETFTWLKIHDREKYWVVLVYPIYGLLCFLVRVYSFFVWLYRRANKYILRTNVYDVWKESSRVVQVIAFIISLSTMVLIYGLMLMIKYNLT